MGQEASFTFTTPLNVNIVNLKGEEHLFVEGDISTNDIDFVNDIMTKNCQESMQKQILERNMKLDLEHEAFKGDSHEEKEINKTKIPAGKIIDATVKELENGRFATSVKCEINRHNPNYKSIKGNLVEKYLDAFSVAFLPTDISYEQREGKAIRMLNDVILLNVAMTGNPCNTKAQMAEVFIKSMDALEEYKKRKATDPSVESMLEVKNKEKKENPLSYIFNKIMSGQVLDKKEIKLLNAAVDVANNKGAYAQLLKELFDKVVSGVRLSYKDYYIFRELIEVDHQQGEEPLMATGIKGKSHSSGKTGDIIKFNTKNSKMTDDNDGNGTEAEGGDAEGEGSDDVEAKSVEMFKSISNELKSMNEKYDAVVKDNVSMKEAQSEMTKTLAKITDALKQPIHKSLNNNEPDKDKDDPETEGKSVDPLGLCH